MTITRVGVDIAKSVFHVHGVDRHDQVLWTGKYSRQKWLDALCRRIPVGAEIGIEACASSHHWARQLKARGYHVRLVAAQFVKPYVKSNKNDRIDAAAICEAMSRPHMRFVSIKTVVQQDIQATHRIRGLVGEYGIVAPIGIQQWSQSGRSDGGITSAISGARNERPVTEGSVFNGLVMCDRPKMSALSAHEKPP